MATKSNTKAIVTLGWQKYVLDMDAAMELFKVLRNVESWNSKYEDNKQVYTVKPIDDSQITLAYLSEEMYAMAKLVGKAEELNNTEEK